MTRVPPIFEKFSEQIVYGPRVVPWPVVYENGLVSLILLKLKRRQAAQIYEAIFAWFRLINYEKIWKSKFFGLICSSNVSKVKYAWVVVKRSTQKKFGVDRGIKWGFQGWPKIMIILKNWCFWTSLKSHSVTQLPQNLNCVYFLIAIQAYFTLETFEEQIRPKNFNFQIFS